MTSPRVLLIGASVRAASQSAVRAGWGAVASDMFGDSDLRAIAEFVPIGSYPNDFAAVVAERDLPVIYTGGLENYPELLSQIPQLWGNSAEPLRLVRDPFFWTDLLKSNGVSVAEVRRWDDPPPDPDGWLVKPLNGAGGAGVRLARDSELSAEGSYFQQRISGDVLSAVFIGAGSRATLCGATRQLVHAVSTEVPFAYGGSVGPIPLSPRVAEQVQRLGDLAANRIGLRGLFGIDFVSCGNSVYPIEFNPRYTASVEVIELAMDVGLLPAHRAACLDEPVVLEQKPRTEAVAKLILYAREDLVVPCELKQQILPLHTKLADIPTVGSPVPANAPLCTVLAHGPTVDAAIDVAATVARHMRRLVPTGCTDWLTNPDIRNSLPHRNNTLDPT